MIPIPDRMKHLKIDRRGYPIPVTVVVDADGKPNFTVNDQFGRQAIIDHDHCGLCGTKLFRGRWFVGGPGAAFHRQGAYLDPPMHDECAHFALRVCPYLAVPRYVREIGMSQKTHLESQGMLVMIDDNASDTRPAVFVAVMATGQRIVGDGAYVKPRAPYAKIEYWQHGRQLGEVEGRALALLPSSDDDAAITAADIARVTR